MNYLVKRTVSLALVFTVSLFSVNSLFGQNIKITPTGRFLFDAAAFRTNDEVELIEGVGVRDLRMGFKAYYEQFFMKADVSFAGNKVSIKDVYLQYSPNDNSLLRGGHFTVPFGLQSAYGTAHKQFMDEPSSNVYQPGRRVGVMHSLWNKNFWLAYGAFADNSALTKSTDVTGKQGYTVAERFVFKPVGGADKPYLLQAGLSLLYMRAEASEKDAPRTIQFKKPYLTIVDKTSAVNALVTDMKYEGRYTAELAGIYKNFVFESQYYDSRVKRKDAPTFKSDGFYAIARAIVVNRANYKYSEQAAGINNPANKALELAVGYNVLNLNDSNSEIYGGKMEDVSVGLSLYWNKYVTFRTNYSYITVTPGNDAPKKIANAFQCRVQYYF